MRLRDFFLGRPTPTPAKPEPTSAFQAFVQLMEAGFETPIQFRGQTYAVRDITVNMDLGGRQRIEATVTMLPQESPLDRVYREGEPEVRSFLDTLNGMDPRR